MEKRITISDLFRLIDEQTGGDITADDFYPVPFVVPISHFVAAEEGIPNIEFTVHPHCGAGTYVYIENGKMIPITRFIDVEGLLEHIDELALNEDKWIGKSLGNLKRIGSLISSLPKYIDTSKAPKSIDVTKLFIDVLKEGTGERIKRCGVHYATPDGRIIPFCTYNTIHRAQVEKKFSTPLLKVRV